MAKTLQFRRGTTAELSSVTGAVGELFVDTEKNTLLVHDGTTGHELVAQDGDATLNSALIGDVSIVGNTIAGVDSYGNADTLVVEGNLNVEFDSTSTSTTTVLNGTFKSALIYGTGAYTANVRFTSDQLWSTAELDKFASITAGQTIDITSIYVNNIGSSFASGYINVISNATSVIDYYGVRTVEFEVSEFFITGYGDIAENNFNSNWNAELFSWTETSGSVVDVLSVTSTGVNVEGTLTVNGQPVGSGGSSYDQSLNTTDDVVFNSALVGDVSITGNTISGVDSYGNPDTLVVEGDLTVRYDSQVTTSGILVNGYTNSIYCYFNYNPYVSGSGTFQFLNSNNNGWPEQDLNTLAAIQPGTVVNFTDLNTSYGNSTGSFIVVSATLSTYYGSPMLNMTVSDISVTLGTNSWVVNGSGISNVNWAWFTTAGSVVDVLEVTETGVDITGTLTVNGQPVGSGGSSYDQSLNTTDDVVFNSALVGDVSVAGNTISGVDSYGNPDLLVVEGDLTVRYDTQVTTSGSLSVTNVSSAYGYFGSETFTFTGGSMGYSSTDLGTLDTLEPGAIVQFTDLSTMFGYVTGSFTVVSSTAYVDYYGVPRVDLVVSNVTVTSGSTAWLSGGSVSNINWVWSATTGSMVDVLDVTSAGVDITGSLTVNGQTVASYDQDLNTTDDVAFNSALIGDVSIVGNTIAGIDSYGNPDTLIVDGDLNVQHTVETVTVLSGLSYDSVIFEATMNPSAGGQVHFQDYGNLDSNTESTLLALTAGQQITLIDNASVSRTYTVVGTATQVGMGGTDVLVYVQELWSVHVTFPSNGDITVATTTITTELSVTDTGVAVAGEFTLSNNNVANSTPSNSSTPAKWAKITVDGQLYFVPLYQ